MARQRIVYDHRQIMSDDVNTITANNILNNQIVLRDAIGLTTGVVNGLDIAAGSVSGLAFPITSGTVSDGDGNFYELLVDTVYTLPDVNAIFNIYAKHTSTDDEPISGYILADVDTRTETYGTVNTRTYDSITITGTTSTLTTGYTFLGTVGVNSSAITGRVDGRQYVTVNNQTGYSIQNFIATDKNTFVFSNKVSGEIYNDNDSANIIGFEAKVYDAQTGTAFKGDAGLNADSVAFEANADSNTAHKVNLFNSATGLLKLINNNNSLGEYVQATGNVSNKLLYSGSILETVTLNDYQIDQSIINHNLTNTSGVSLTNRRVRSSDGSRWTKINHFSDYDLATHYEQSGTAIANKITDINGNETTGIVFDNVAVPFMFKSGASSVANLPASLPTNYAGYATVGSGSTISDYYWNGSNWSKASPDNSCDLYEQTDLIISGFTAVADNGGDVQVTYTGSLFDLAHEIAFKSDGLDTYDQTGVTGNSFTITDNGSNQYTINGLTYSANASTSMKFVIASYKLKSDVKKYFIDNYDTKGAVSRSSSNTVKVYMPTTGTILDGQEWEVYFRNPAAHLNHTTNYLDSIEYKIAVYKNGAGVSDNVKVAKMIEEGTTNQQLFYETIVKVIIRYDASKAKFIAFTTSNT